MPWVRRTSTVAATVGTALLVYTIYVALILHKISSFIRICPLHGQQVVTRASKSSGPWGVLLWGYFIPLWIMVMLWLCIPATWIAFEIVHWVQRQNRERLGLCLDCGY